MTDRDKLADRVRTEGKLLEQRTGLKLPVFEEVAEALRTPAPSDAEVAVIADLMAEIRIRIDNDESGYSKNLLRDKGLLSACETLLRKVTELEGKGGGLCNQNADLMVKLHDAKKEVERLQALHLERTKSTHKALTQRDKEIERLTAALREIAEFDMEQDCLPACDSYSHADLCPWTAAEYCMAKIARKALKGDGDVQD